MCGGVPMFCSRVDVEHVVFVVDAHLDPEVAVQPLTALHEAARHLAPQHRFQRLGLRSRYLLIFVAEQLLLP